MPIEYARPIEVASPKECFFYHSTDLAGHGHIKGHWDLRDCAHAYLGNVDFKGKRTLDVGAASGFLSFEMEKLGAEVVSFDLDDGSNWDVVPHYKLRDELPAIRAAQSATLVRLKKAYWLAHSCNKSKAQAYYGNIYAMPKELGEFDVIFYGMIIGHLRDIFQALYNGARLCRETMVVTSIFGNWNGSTCRFHPTAANASNYAIKGWWGVNIDVLKSMLGVLGFEVVDTVCSEPLCFAEKFEGPQRCTALVATRVG